MVVIKLYCFTRWLLLADSMMNGTWFSFCRIKVVFPWLQLRNFQNLEKWRYLLSPSAQFILCYSEQTPLWNHDMSLLKTIFLVAFMLVYKSEVLVSSIYKCRDLVNWGIAPEVLWNLLSLFLTPLYYWKSGLHTLIGFYDIPLLYLWWCLLFYRNLLSLQ